MDVVSDIKLELASLGLQASFLNVYEFYSWLRRIKLIYSPPLLKIQNNTLQYKNIVFSDITIAMSGKFGKAYLAYREKENENESDNSYCFLKTTPTHPDSLLVEGIMQTCAYTILKKYGFPKAVPRVLDIMRHPSDGIILCLEKIQGARMFADFLKDNLQWGEPSEINDRIILSVFAQIATFTAILEAEIGMNHRDLKGTNVLMISPDENVHRKITLHSYEWSINSQFQVVLIDFGFSCIGQSGGNMIISAGDYLPEIDFCPKQGRDLFLFFASLWNIELFRKSVTEETAKLFYSWLRDSVNPTNWAHWLVNSAQPDIHSMYLLVNASHFRSPASAPIEVLSDIARVYPDVVQISTIKRPPTPAPGL